MNSEKVYQYETKVGDVLVYEKVDSRGWVSYTGEIELPHGSSFQRSVMSAPRVCEEEARQIRHVLVKNIVDTYNVINPVRKVQFADRNVSMSGKSYNRKTG